MIFQPVSEREWVPSHKRHSSSHHPLSYASRFLMLLHPFCCSSLILPPSLSLLLLSPMLPPPVRAWRDGLERPFLIDTVWDLLHLVDYLVTRPDVDPGRIGITGKCERGEGERDCVCVLVGVLVGV